MPTTSGQASRLRESRPAEPTPARESWIFRSGEETRPLFLDNHVWLSATVFSGLCGAIVMACHQRDWLLTTPLVRQGAHAVLDRKFAQVLKARALFDPIWSEAACVDAVDGGCLVSRRRQGMGLRQ